LVLSSFYRRLAPTLQKLLATNRADQKGCFISLGDPQGKALEHLMGALCSEQFLVSPVFSASFILTTDASKVALGTILSQVENRVERTLSRQVNKAQQNYSASEL
jgi:hypothetical protein